jgi:hypothetical protein
MLETKNVEKTPLDEVRTSTYKLMSGCGEYIDYTRVFAGLIVCENKLNLNSSLGFSKELKSFKQMLLKIMSKVKPLDDPNPGENWISPFITQQERSDISILFYLLVKQFLFNPTLDPNEDIVVSVQEMHEVLGIRDKSCFSCF